MSDPFSTSVDTRYPTLGKLYESHYGREPEEEPTKLVELPPTQWNAQETEPPKKRYGFFKKEGDEYPRLRLPLGGVKDIETYPSWFYSKEGLRKAAVEGVPQATHRTADTLGEVVVNPAATVRRVAEASMEELRGVYEDFPGYARNKYSEVKEALKKASGDPVEGAQIPVDIALALATRSPRFQRALRLSEHPVDELTVGTVAAEKMIGEFSGGDDKDGDAGYFPATRKAAKEFFPDIKKGYAELGQVGEKDPRYAEYQESASNMAYLLKKAFGSNDPFMADEDPFAVPVDEEPTPRYRKELTSQKLRE